MADPELVAEIAMEVAKPALLAAPPAVLAGAVAPTFLPMADGEVLITDKDEYYFRQCHPQFLTDGVPSTQMFGDFAQDGGKLSGNRSTAALPKQAFDFHTETLGNKSAGTWAVSVGEVTKVSSRVVDDTNAPTVRPPDPVPPGHSYVDMRHLTSKERRRLRGELRIAAVSRGRVHPDATNALQLPADESDQQQVSAPVDGDADGS
jgi:hypothetical protein